LCLLFCHLHLGLPSGCFTSDLLIYLRRGALPEKLPILQPFRKFPAILRNPKAHHRVHKSPQLVPILSQFDPVHTIPSYISKIQFNIVHPPLLLGLPSGLFPSGFPTNILYAFHVSPIRATCPAHLIFFFISDLSTKISWATYLLPIACDLKKIENQFFCSSCFMLKRNCKGQNCSLWQKYFRKIIDLQSLIQVLRIRHLCMFLAHCLLNDKSESGRGSNLSIHITNSMEPETFSRSCQLRNYSRISQ
jgi:hypothetical protein